MINAMCREVSGLAEGEPLGANCLLYVWTEAHHTSSALRWCPKSQRDVLWMTIFDVSRHLVLLRVLLRL